MLAEALRLARTELELSRVLVTCDDDNIASIRVIEKNGGVLDSIATAPDLAKPKRLRSGHIAEGYAVDDGAAVHFVDGRVLRVVASRPAARAYRVTLDHVSSIVTESPLQSHVLDAVTPSWPTF